MKCSWEAGDDLGGTIENAHDRIMVKRRSKNGSTASKWRDLKESDMLQYMASSDSESETGEIQNSDSDSEARPKKTSAK